MKSVLIIAAMLLPVGCAKKPSADLPSILVPAPELAANTSVSKDAKARFAIIVSMDGLGAQQLRPLIEAGRMPNFVRLRQESSWTFDARTDVTDTRTMANHTCMLTGLPSDRPTPDGRTLYHGYHYNGDPPPDVTLHRAGNPDLRYVPSVFDVAHDAGLKTCLFSGKEKFRLFSVSWGPQAGAPDRIGTDNGRDKLDVGIVGSDTDALADRFLEEMRSKAPCNLTLFHVADLDEAGHAHGWESEAWKGAAERADRVLGKILDAVQSSAPFKGHTALIVTADHGGVGNKHGNTADNRIFTIPFYVAAPGITGNTDLYTKIRNARTKPSATENPSYAAPQQPVRNGDAGNLALSLLGLPPVPGSLMYGLEIQP